MPMTPKTTYMTIREYQRPAYLISIITQLCLVTKPAWLGLKKKIMV